MRPSLLASRVPHPTGDAQIDIANLSTALHDILRTMDEFISIFQVGGDVYIGSNPVAARANRGFLAIPAIDGSGPPLGTPTNRKAGDPIVRTRLDNKLWAYDFVQGKWVEIAASDDDQEILELLFLILTEMELHRELGL